MIGWTGLLFEGMQTLGLYFGLEKQVKTLSGAWWVILIGTWKTSAEGSLNCGDLAQQVSEEKRVHI